MAKLTPKQTEIFKLLEPALVGQKLPLESSAYSEYGVSILKAKKVITKKAVQEFVADGWPDEQADPEVSD